MKSFFKKGLWPFILLFIAGGCFNFGYEPEPPLINGEERELIRMFASQNGYPESMPFDSFVEYLYKDWPKDYEKYDYL